MHPNEAKQNFKNIGRDIKQAIKSATHLSKKMLEETCKAGSMLAEVKKNLKPDAYADFLREANIQEQVAEAYIRAFNSALDKCAKNTPVSAANCLEEISNG